MVKKSEISRDLHKLNRLYLSALLSPDPYLPMYYSKLAVLELCGWIEDCMDDIIGRYVKRKKLRLISNTNYVKDSIIDRTHGFNYEGNFKRMLISTIGIVLTDKLELKINSPVLTRLKSNLEYLKGIRDPHAHSYLGSVMILPTIAAPSVMLKRLDEVCEDLHTLERKLKYIN